MNVIDNPDSSISNGLNTLVSKSKSTVTGAGIGKND